MAIKRRDFLGGALAAGAGTLVAPRGAQGADSKIEVLLGEPVGTISPNIYGHFVEHLGGVVYDGIWVGEGSKIPNVGGVRAALVEHLRRIKPAVVRWPGGCFADSYNWRDGTGPRGERPRRTNFWISDSTKDSDSPQVYETNHFGTNEFMRFCKLVGAEPYLAANLRSLPAKDFYEWVEYCNAPANLTTLSRMRAAAGDAEPFGVRFWGVGNESWGCGGNFTPEEYATEFRRFVAWVPRYGLKLNFIAAGPDAGDWNWTRGFFAKLAEKGDRMLGSLYAFALHYYAGIDAPRKASTDYDDAGWYELLTKADRMESLITEHWAIMGGVHTRHRVKLVVDEWGAWHGRAKEMPATYLWAYPGTLRDALISGLTLDTFNRHADKVVMANVAQTVNTIHSLFLAHEDKFVATPNFHVFEMYSAHGGGQSLRTVFTAPDITTAVNGRPAKLWGLQGSASLSGKQLTLTAVNPDIRAPRETEISIQGARVASAQARVLSSSDIHAHNTFANPRALEPRDGQVAVGAGGRLVYRFAPASVTRLQLTLA